MIYENSLRYSNQPSIEKWMFHVVQPNRAHEISKFINKFITQHQHRVNSNKGEEKNRVLFYYKKY